MVSGKHAFVLVRDWLPRPKPIERDAALAELARRYLAGHGPATDRDLARWAGMTLGDARRGLASISSELEDSTAATGLMDLRGRSEPAELPPPRLLGAFDPSCSDGPRARTSWDRIATSSPTTACSARSRW